MGHETFEQAGLLDGLTSAEERAARLQLLEYLSASGLSLDELQAAAAEERLALLPVERLLTRDCRYTVADVAGASGLSEEFLIENRIAGGHPRPRRDELAFTESNQEAAMLADALSGIVLEDVLRESETERDLAFSLVQLAEAFTPALGRFLIATFETHQRAGEAGLPPVHVGVASGPAIQRAGDWYGHTVNVASRVTGKAARGQIVSTPEVRNDVGERSEFAPLGETALKGIEDSITLYQLVPP